MESRARGTSSRRVTTSSGASPTVPCVDADLVSRQHAKLVLNYGHAPIEGLGSSNSTSVDGQPIPKAEGTLLWPNPKIQVGTATIVLRRFRQEASEMSLAPEQAMVRRALAEEFLREKIYDIGKVIAQGGMGAILDAREATTERTVAPQFEHPNIPPIHELSVDEISQPC